MIVIKCPACEGEGTQECECCSGTGDKDCSTCMATHECQCCQGDGEVDCEICGGSGATETAGLPADAERTACAYCGREAIGLVDTVPVCVLCEAIFMAGGIPQVLDKRQAAML